MGLRKSAFTGFLSTETVLVKVQNDILCAIDQQQSVILLLLDLSAVFNTVDHELLISRLRTRFGIKGNALRWLESYLQDRKQFVQVDAARSASKDLQCGVPQGSVLGLLLYLLYTAPLGDIIRQFEVIIYLFTSMLNIANIILIQNHSG